MAHILGRVLCLLGCGPPSVARALCELILWTSSGSVPTSRSVCVPGPLHPVFPSAARLTHCRPLVCTCLPPVVSPPTEGACPELCWVWRSLLTPVLRATLAGSTVLIQRTPFSCFFPLVSRCLWVLCGHRHGLSEAWGPSGGDADLQAGRPPDCSTCLCLLDDSGHFLKGISFCNTDGVALLQNPRVCVEMNSPRLVVPSTR